MDFGEIFVAKDFELEDGVIFALETGAEQVAREKEQVARNKRKKEEAEANRKNRHKGDFQKGVDSYTKRDYAIALRELGPFPNRGCLCLN